MITFEALRTLHQRRQWQLRRLLVYFLMAIIASLLLVATYGGSGIVFAPCFMIVTGLICWFGFEGQRWLWGWPDCRNCGDRPRLLGVSLVLGNCGGCGAPMVESLSETPAPSLSFDELVQRRFRIMKRLAFAFLLIVGSWLTLLIGLGALWFFGTEEPSPWVFRVAITGLCLSMPVMLLVVILITRASQIRLEAGAVATATGCLILMTLPRDDRPLRVLRHAGLSSPARLGHFGSART